MVFGVFFGGAFDFGGLWWFLAILGGFWLFLVVLVFSWCFFTTLWHQLKSLKISESGFKLLEIDFKKKYWKWIEITVN